MPRCSRSIVLLIVPLVLAACRDQKVTSYRIPKEKEAETSAAAAHAAAGLPPQPGAPMPAAGAPPAGGSMGDTAVATAGGAGLKWTAPASWQSKAASAMRKATFVITGDGDATAELAVTAFPGDVGGEVANVNRWRGQVQLPPLSPADAASSITRVEANGLKIGVVDLVSPGASPTRLLGAWVPYQGSTWFFKLSGPDAVVAKEKPAFMQFLNTIQAATP